MISVNVSNEVTPATLYMFLNTLSDYEHGLTKYIQELCGVHINQSLTEWFDILSNFKINSIYLTQELQNNINNITDNNKITNNICSICDYNNIRYYGDPIKNFTINRHCMFLENIYRRYSFHVFKHTSIIWSFNLWHICNKWVINGATPITDELGDTRTAFFNNFKNSPQYSHNNPPVWKDPSLITKCDVIFWILNEQGMYDENCIDNDSNNILELIYHVPKRLAIDTPNDEGYNKESYFIQGCVATVIAKYINKMPIYTKFNPILQKQEYSKNYLSEYIKSQ